MSATHAVTHTFRNICCDYKTVCRYLLQSSEVKRSRKAVGQVFGRKNAGDGNGRVDGKENKTRVKR
jgi:hypothetical protein